ncbi:MAG: glycosyltransferase [Cyanobacteria bacterium P01_D01_bin.44]
MAQKFTVNVVTGQGGGGHYATYHALRAVAEQRGLPWQFQVTDMDEMITNLSQQNQIKNAYEMFGFSGHDLYNLMVKGGWTWLWPLKMRLNKLLVKLNHDIGVKIFETYWGEQQPDLVVSVMPLYNKGLWESLQKAKPGAPYVTVLTDFADCPPAFWLDPDAGNFLVCGTQRAADQARDLGIADQRIIETSGLVIHPSFYADSLPEESHARQRQQLGLAPDRPTGLVMFGGNGSDVMLKIARRLETFQDQIQLIFICGHNQAQSEALRLYKGPQKRAIVGFTDAMADYMRLSDFFIGKPGNVSVSEALAMKLPVITECNVATMSQERYCAEWVSENKVGLVISTFQKIDQAVAELIRPEVYGGYRSNLARFNNQAVFEVTDGLQKILEKAYSGSALALAGS